MQKIIPLINRIILLVLLALVFEETFFYRLQLPRPDIIIYSMLGVYWLLTLVELALNLKSARASKVTGISFNYLTKFFRFKKLMVNLFILAFAYIVIQLGLHTGRVNMLMSSFLVSIVGADVLSFVVRWLGGHYRVLLEEYTYSIVEDQEKVVNAARIKEVEFRYDIFFFKMKNGDAGTIGLESIKKTDRRRFAEEMVHWIEAHNIPITTEGRENLKQWV